MFIPNKPNPKIKKKKLYQIPIEKEKIIELYWNSYVNLGLHIVKNVSEMFDALNRRPNLIRVLYQLLIKELCSSKPFCHNCNFFFHFVSFGVDFSFQLCVSPCGTKTRKWFGKTHRWFFFFDLSFFFLFPGKPDTYSQKLTVEFNLYTEADPLVRSKKIRKVNRPKSLHWSVQNWKRLQKCYSIAQMHHHKTTLVVLVAVHHWRKKAVHRQPGGYTRWQKQNSNNNFKHFFDAILWTAIILVIYLFIKKKVLNVMWKVMIFCHKLY